MYHIKDTEGTLTSMKDVFVSRMYTKISKQKSVFPIQLLVQNVMAFGSRLENALELWNLEGDSQIFNSSLISKYS